MKLSLLEFLLSPCCKCVFSLNRLADDEAGNIEGGSLICNGCQAEFIIVDGVPDFTDKRKTITQNAFDQQWNCHTLVRLRRTLFLDFLFKTMLILLIMHLV